MQRLFVHDLLECNYKCSGLLCHAPSALLCLSPRGSETPFANFAPPDVWGNDGYDPPGFDLVDCQNLLQGGDPLATGRPAPLDSNQPGFIFKSCFWLELVGGERRGWKDRWIEQLHLNCVKYKYSLQRVWFRSLSGEGLSGWTGNKEY